MSPNPVAIIQCPKCGAHCTLPFPLGGQNVSMVGCATRCPKCGSMFPLPDYSGSFGRGQVRARPGAGRLMFMDARAFATAIAEARDAAAAKSLLETVAGDKTFDPTLRVVAKALLQYIEFFKPKKINTAGIAALVLLLGHILKWEGCSAHDADAESKIQRAADQHVVLIKNDPKLNVTVNVTIQNGPTPEVKAVVEPLMQDDDDQASSACPPPPTK